MTFHSTLFLRLLGLATTPRLHGKARRLILSALITQALGNSNEPQVVLLRPVDQPGSERVDRAGIRLVHKRDVAVSTGAGLRELLLRLGGRLVVPVARVDVVRDHLVVHRLEHGQDLAARLEVRGAHVERLLADQVGESVFELGHFGGDLGGGVAGHVGVGPGGLLAWYLVFWGLCLGRGIV